MQYISTRGASPKVSLSAGLTAGLAPDGGLYMPEALPQLSALDAPRGLAAVGRWLLGPFFVGDPLEAHLDAIVAEAFSPPAPLVPTLHPRLQLLELFRGPTAAFKDFGARFLAAALARVPGAELTTILVATSGDTGGAVAAAFHRRPGFRVVVLYPDGGVSPRQAHQLEAFGDNVVTLRVQGTFDDCQALVKDAFGDTNLRARVAMTSANSISLGRLLPQMVYHAAAALEFSDQVGRPVGSIVPTGNLGNALAAWMVGALGLPVAHVVMATNANDVLPHWLSTGLYEPKPSLHTLANAMDVGAPSNLERLRWLLDADIEGPALSAWSVVDERIQEVLGQAEEHFGHVVCPHTACALDAFQYVVPCQVGPWMAVATAHPAKFDEVVEPAIGRQVEVPEVLAALLARPRVGRPLEATASALRQVLEEVC